MDSTSSFAEFFYNLVPGAIFTLILWIMFFPYINVADSTKIFLVVIFGLFFGFFLQGIIRMLRRTIFFGDNIFTKVIQDSSKKFQYKVAIKILFDNHLIDDGGNNENALQIKQNLHVMDNYLRAKKFKSTTEHFAAKSAFWSNICLVSFFSLFFIVIAGLNSGCSSTGQLLFLLASLTMIFSYLVSKEYYISQYDVVIKSFISIIQLEKNYVKSKFKI